MCNKPAPFYWLHSPHQIDSDGQRTHTPKITVSGLREEWYRWHDEEPSIEFGHFLGICFELPQPAHRQCVEFLKCMAQFVLTHLLS